LIPLEALTVKAIADADALAFASAVATSTDTAPSFTDWKS
jgi:hypothetical protein